MSATQNQLNLLRNANQIQTIGATQPPNMANIPDRVLQAASPIHFNLLEETKVSQNLSDRASENCRSFKDIEGLRRLQEVQKDRTFYESGCGWIYKPSNGINPEVNQGALGTHQGPSTDKLPSGAKWLWDLNEAEKEISQKICSNSTKCSQLRLLGKYADICGYCKTTRATIPIVRNGGSIKARYPNSPALMCEPSELVTSGAGSCPAESEGFRNSARVRNEGFTTLDDLDSCKSPLTRDCVVLAARLSGCSDNGTLIQSLKTSSGSSYDTTLRNTMAFNAYQSSANPNLTRQIFQDGSVSIATALDDFGRLLQNTSAGEEKLRASARDLCLKAGDFDTYDFCREVSDTTVINKDYIKCVQEDWKRNGGTEAGTAYPTLQQYNGITWANYIRRRNQLMAEIQSPNKEINVRALSQFIGVNTQGEQLTTVEMARDETTRGAETVWIDTRENGSGNFDPIILKCELKLAKDGAIYPEFNNKESMSAVHGVPQDNIAFTTAFELRPENDSIASFQVTTDDGFMLSMNQNPFENTSHRENDWGSWRYQGPTTYQSRDYYIHGVKKSATNTVVFKWFHGGGIAAHMLYPRINGFIKRQAQLLGDRTDMYLTQEPLAPWLQYEICERPNLNDGSRLGFFEKRWNGPAAYTWGAGNKKIPSFDVHSKSIAMNSKDKFMTFTKGSSWHTASRFAYTAFKTITLCIRPRPTLANGARALVFNHTNVGGLDIGFSLINRNGTYMFTFWNGRNWTDIPAAMNEWNFIVIQYIGDRNGIRNITIHGAPLETLKANQTAKGQFLQQLRSNQGVGGSILAVDPVFNRNHAGYLVLGMVAPTMKDINNNPVRPGVESFTGDVKWIHGFRNFIDTDRLLTAEIQERWISRWPRDMPIVQNPTNLKKTFIGFEGQRICVPNNTLVSYEAGIDSRQKTTSGCFQATNNFFGGDPRWGVRKSVFGFL